jgi:hypothetical protein
VRAQPPEAETQTEHINRGSGEIWPSMITIAKMIRDVERHRLARRGISMNRHLGNGGHLAGRGPRAFADRTGGSIRSAPFSSRHGYGLFRVPPSPFRSKRGAIARLACFALACQFFVAFGHLHLSKFGGGSITLALSDCAGNGSASDSFSPTQKKQNGPAGFCAICAQDRGVVTL